MKLLSIHMGLHDNNCSYFDGKSLHYCKSERTHQIKHHAYNSLKQIIDDLKNIWGITLEEIDQIALSGLGRAHQFGLQSPSPEFFPSVVYNNFPLHKNVVIVNHHYAHSLSTNILCETKPKVYFVIDGQGQNRSWSVHKDNKIIDEGLEDECGSIGNIMSEVGRSLGIEARHNDDIAGKLMGLQSFGKLNQDYYDKIKRFGMRDINELFRYSIHNDDIAGKLMGLQSFGKLNQDYYDKIKRFGMRDINELFRYSIWKECNYYGYSDLDWIHTVHERVGDLLIEFFLKYANEHDTISYSGGVAQNIIWNTKLKNKFPNLIIGPHSSDEGLSIGSMEYMRIINNLPPMVINNFPYSQQDECPPDEPTEDIIKHAAKELAEGKIIAWYQGNGEIGPRALGNRSILMDPRLVDGKDKVNLIKNRENYRPFGASVLEECVSDYFSIPFAPFLNPYMLYLVNAKNDTMPAITHVDGTCRLQTVGNENILFRKLLEEFYRITGCPVLLNTSLNVAGKPIASKCSDAVLLFETTKLDALFVGNKMFLKHT